MLSHPQSSPGLLFVFVLCHWCSMLVEAPPTTRRRKGRSSGVQWKSAEPRAATSLRAIIAKSQSVATNKASVPHV